MDVSLVTSEKIQSVKSRTRGRRRFPMEGPDGGWAWCVAIAACLINFIMAGLGRMSGILYVAFIEMFSVNRKTATMPFSIRSSTRNLLGPLVGILGQQYGVRTITMMGGVVGTLSSAACYFVNDMNWITILWGGFNGVGTALTTTLPQVVIGLHFDKHHTTAAGLAFSGGCVGSFIFPVLIEYLLQNYGLQGTFLILSGVVMHVIPAAMILRKPSWKKQSGFEPTTPEKNGSSEVSNAVTHVTNGSLGERIETKPVVIELTESERTFPWLQKDVTLVVKVVLFGMKCILSNDDNKEFSERSFDEEEEKEMVRDALCNIVNVALGQSGGKKGLCNSNLQYIAINSRLVKFFEVLEGNETEFAEKLPQTEIPNDTVLNIFTELIGTYALYRQAIDGIVHTNNKEPSGESSNSSEKRSTAKALLEHLKTAAILHTNPIFLMVCLSRAVHFITFVPVITVMVDFGMDNGLSEEDGKYIIGALSAGDLIGRLGFGWITDKGFLGVAKYMLIVMSIQGASTASLPFMTGKIPMMLMFAVFGLLQGSLFIRHPVVISKYMGKKELSIAMGCINFLSGLCGFALPSYIGYFRDTLGSYNRMFYITGAIGTSIGLLWAFEPQYVKFIDRCKESKIETKPTE